MQGGTVDALELVPTGALGDRVWAVRDEEKGGIRGAKKIAGLMGIAARFVEEPTPDRPAPAVELTLPDLTAVRSDDPAVDARLSAALGRPVSLQAIRPADDLDHYRRGAPDSDDLDVELRSIFGRLPDEPLPDLMPFLHVIEYESPPGSYVDAYPVHLLTQQTLDWLQGQVPGSTVDVRRFRPNLVVDAPGGDDAFPDRAWIGHRVTVGEVELEVVYDCPRCVMITRPFADLPADRDILRTVVREADQNIGVYANVLRPGVVRPGDEVTLLV
jgi:uncharacterized protein YcbX